MNAAFVLMSKLQSHECSKGHMLAVCTGHVDVSHATQEGREGRGGGAVLTQGGADIVDGARRVRLGDEGVAAGGLALAEAG